MNYILTSALLVLSLETAIAQWFDKQSLSCTVLLEKFQDSSYIPHGTGFVLWNYSNPNAPIVVTAGHLLNRTELYVSVNADSALLSFARRQKLDTLQFNKLKWAITGDKLRAKVRLVSSPKPTFVRNDSLDIGIFLIDLASRGMMEPGDTIRFADFQLIPRSQIRLKRDISLGDEFYFVGFPFGFGVSNRLEPIVRSGSVAWQSSFSPHFLLDAFSFGGNSGGPVFSKIVLGRQPGMLAWDDAFLVGMIIAHHGEKIVGVLSQPDPTTPRVERVTFEAQNYGLAQCVWIDDILNIIDHAKHLHLPE